MSKSTGIIVKLCLVVCPYNRQQPFNSQARDRERKRAREEERERGRARERKREREEERERGRARERKSEREEERERGRARERKSEREKEREREEERACYNHCRCREKGPCSRCETEQTHSYLPPTEVPASAERLQIRMEFSDAGSTILGKEPYHLPPPEQALREGEEVGGGEQREPVAEPTAEAAGQRVEPDPAAGR